MSYSECDSSSYRNYILMATQNDGGLKKIQDNDDDLKGMEDGDDRPGNTQVDNGQQWVQFRIIRSLIKSTFFYLYMRRVFHSSVIFYE